MSDFVLYPQDIERINSILGSFIQAAELECTLVTTKDGQLLTYAGKTDAIDTTSVAALVTGSFAATVTIANLIGEPEFRTMFHRGKDRHFHICLIDAERYLASVFTNKTPVEHVSHYANYFAKELSDLFKLMNANADDAVLPDFFSQEDAAQTDGGTYREDVFHSLQDLETLEEQAEQEADAAIPLSEGDTQQRPSPVAVTQQKPQESPASPELLFIRKKVMEAAQYRSQLLK